MQNKSGQTPRCFGGIIGVLVVLLVGAWALLGCQSQPAAPAAPTSAPAPAATSAPAPAQPTAQAPQAQSTQAPAASAAQETIKVGVVFGLTGPGATQGRNIVRWMELGLDDVNAKGGVKVGGKTYRFEAVVVDDKNTAEGGRDAANKLVLADKVKYILGMGTAATNAAVTVTNPAKVMIMGSPASFKFGPDQPFVFLIMAAYATTRGDVLYEYMSQTNPNAKRLAIARPDDAQGRANADMYEKIATEKGFTVVAKEFYPVDMKDAGPLVTRLLRSNPDVVDAESGNTVAIWLIFQEALNAQGFKGLRIGASGDTASLNRGLPYLEGYTTAQLLDPQSPLVPAGAKEVIQRYSQKYPDSQQAESVAIYHGGWLLAQAMEKAGTIDDTDKVVKTLREGQWDTIWSKELGKSGFGGTKTFGLASVMDQPIYLGKVENGKAVNFKAMMGRLP